MQHYLAILLVVSAPNLVLGNPQAPATSCVTSGQKPFLLLKAETLTDDLKAAFERLDCVQRVYKKKELTEEQRTELQGIIYGLEQLPGRTQEEVTAIFRKYADETADFFAKLDAFVIQRDPYVDYQEILDYYDKDLLKGFSKIQKHESEVLLVCTKWYISRFQLDEETNYRHSPSSVALCVFRQLILDMAAELKMLSNETAQSIAKSLVQAFPEAAAMVYIKGYITGDYLAMPLVLAEKMLQVLPRRRIATMTLSKLNAAEGDLSLAKSEVAKLLQNSGPSVETVVGATIEKMVRYYESLGGSVFCQLQSAILESFGPHSMSYLAFARSNAHTCIRDYSERSAKKFFGPRHEH